LDKNRAGLTGYSNSDLQIAILRFSGARITVASRCDGMGWYFLAGIPQWMSKYCMAAEPELAP
jgi:hypothetical protein